MKTYTAVLMHGNRDGEGHYTFEAPVHLSQASPVRIMRALMEHIQETAKIGHIDYEINAAMKNKEANVVTVLGELQFENASTQPYVCMIDI